MDKVNSILFFGIAKDIAQTDKVYGNYEGMSVLQLKESLQGQYAELSDIKYFMVAVNEAYAEDHQIIKSGDEIAIIPPVSGG